MLISNFNLCKSEWLELVFAQRNKEYGAYELRQHQPQTQLKSLFAGVFGVVVFVGIVGAVIKAKPITEAIIQVKLDNTLYKVSPPPARKPKPKTEAPKPAPAQASTPINTTKYIQMVVTNDPVTVEPPKLEDLKGAVGQTDVKNGVAGINAGDGSDKPGTGIGAGDGTAGEPAAGFYKAVELMPQPVGGDGAWSKFLQSNIHYPDKALENQVSGRVYVSFIIEKDGHLSNIHVERGPGFGMDEEAVRVLKLAKPWKPGMQNGQAVRVQLTLPVNFTLGD